MTPFWSDDHLTLYGGDCRAVLAELPAQSVHTVVTSPPYWGLRDYGTATWDGGDSACDHSPAAPSRATRPANGLTGGKATIDAGTITKGDCGRCGAVRIDSQLGLEATPEEFVANMVAVFREVKRVLRDDGTLWLNLGDSYVAGQGGRQSAVGEMPAQALRSDANPRKRDDVDTGSWGERDATVKMTPARGTTVLKPKDLVGIPWRVAFALQADGWYLRSDIIWSKLNPMPESVTDRPTKAHEYLFLLTKSPRYYYDADAVREDGAGRTDVGRMTSPARLNQGGPWTATEKPEAGRNLRTVWTIATEPYPGAHFATFPRKLVEPCVKAGTSERGVCPECGAPWDRVVEPSERYAKYLGKGFTDHANDLGAGMMQNRGVNRQNAMLAEGITGRETVTTGWRPTCAHDGEPVPATVLDPFAGSGTTLLVAQSLGRKGVGIDLSPEYLKQALARNAQTPLGLVG